MASLSGFKSWIAGATGSQGVLGPEASWRIYVLPRGAHASQASSGALITFDSANAAARFAANDWVQVSTSSANIRQVAAVGGNSINVGTAVTVAQNDRVFLIGSTQPTVTGGSASYQPRTTIWARDDDGGSPISNSMLTSDSNGGFEFFARNNFYDALIQDSNQSAQMSLVDIAVGVTATQQLPVPFVYNVKDPEFGAIGGNDSTVDDRAAIQAALDAAAVDLNGAQAAVVYLPRDTYHIGAQLRVPRSTRFIGDGVRNSLIKCGDGWAGTSFMVFLGDNNANSHQTRIEHIGLDCNNKTLTGGVEATYLQEASGLFNVLVANSTDTGVSFGANCQNCSIMGCEIAGESSGFLGIRWTRIAGVGMIQDVTVGNADFGANSTRAGILLAGGNNILSRVHLEYFSTGIGITTSPTGTGGEYTIINANPHVSAGSSYVIHLNDNAQGSLTAINIGRGAATTPLYDEVAGVSINSAQISYYVHNSVSADEIILAPDTNATPNFVNPQKFTFGCTTEFRNAVGFSKAIIWGRGIDASANADLDVAGRAYLEITSGAGTSITGFVGGFTGQVLDVMNNLNGTVGVVRGNTIAMVNAVENLTRLDYISFRCINGVSWVQRFPVTVNGSFA